MTNARRRTIFLALIAVVTLSCVSCRQSADEPRTGVDANVTKLGTIEVTARLVEVPEGAIFKRDLYNYATVLKYEVLQVHRGTVPGKVIYVGHYNPFKPRGEAADQRVKGIGGDLAAFEGGQVHRMALEPSIDDCYMGGIVNKYFGKMPKPMPPIHWAVWTNLVEE
jgi:hypothetical protein